MDILLILTIVASVITIVTFVYDIVKFYKRKNSR